MPYIDTSTRGTSFFNTPEFFYPKNPGGGKTHTSQFWGGFIIHTQLLVTGVFWGPLCENLGFEKRGFVPPPGYCGANFNSFATVWTGFKTTRLDTVWAICTSSCVYGAYFVAGGQLRGNIFFAPTRGCVHTLIIPLEEIFFGPRIYLPGRYYPNLWGDHNPLPRGGFERPKYQASQKI